MKKALCQNEWRVKRIGGRLCRVPYFGVDIKLNTGCFRMKNHGDVDAFHMGVMKDHYNL